MPADRYAALAALVPASGAARDQYNRLRADLEASRARIRRLEDAAGRRTKDPAATRELLRSELGRELAECRAHLRNVVAANVELVKAQRSHE